MNYYQPHTDPYAGQPVPAQPVRHGQIAAGVLAYVTRERSMAHRGGYGIEGKVGFNGLADQAERDRIAVAALDAQLAQAATMTRLAEAVEALTGVAAALNHATDRATEHLATIGGELGNIDVRLDVLSDDSGRIVEAVDGVHDVLVDVRHEVASLVAGVDSGVEIAETVVYGRRRWPVRCWQAATGWWRRRRAGQAAEVSPAEVTEVQSTPPSADEIKAMAQSVVEEEWADWQQIWGRWDRAMDAAEQRAAYRWTWWPVWWRQAITAWWRRRRGVDPAGVLVVRDEVHDLLAGGAPAGVDLAEANRQLITLENALARYEQGQGRDSDG